MLVLSFSNQQILAYPRGDSRGLEDAVLDITDRAYNKVLLVVCISYTRYIVIRQQIN